MCFILLVLSFFTYGKYVERVFGPTDAQKPEVRFANGVDYVPMPLGLIFTGIIATYFIIKMKKSK
ncbi:MAG: hypothetical protein IKP23_03285 [Elusimicrobiaceae bacterium]|nr:hypothetical protein [Elusimicrobiaceae bacterium]